MTSTTEQRTIDVDVRDLDTRGRTLHGYAAVYGGESEDLGGFREQIAPGAFADVLPSADVRALLNHDPNQVLGRTRSGTLRLVDDERGLRFECDLPDSPLGENVREAVRRGDVDGASFRFVCGEEQWSEGGEIRTVTKVAELHDVTVATYGAYPAASVELRTREQPKENDTMEVEDREGGGLAVEDRTAPDTQPPIEERVNAALRSVRKGENRALTTASVDAITPPELSSYLFDKLRASSVALRTGIRVIPTDRDSIQWPKLTTDVDPTWVAEAATIPAGDPAFTTLTATPRKLAHRVVMSNE